MCIQIPIWWVYVLKMDLNMSMLVGTSDMPIQIPVFQLPCHHSQAGDSTSPPSDAAAVPTPARWDPENEMPILSQEDTWKEVAR